MKLVVNDAGGHPLNFFFDFTDLWMDLSNQVVLRLR